MNPILDGLITTHFTEHVMLDGALRVRSYSRGAPDYAFTKATLAEGRDARDAFPELVGAEETLHNLLLGRSSEWSLHGVNRADQRSSPFYISIIVRPKKDPHHTSRTLELLLADVTEIMLQLQKITQTSNSATLFLHSLTSSRTFVENILDSMTDALLVTSSQGAIEKANRAAVGLLGFSTEEIIGKPIQQFIQELPLNKSSQVLDNIEVTCRSRNGEEVPMLFSLSPIHSDTDRGIVYVGRDLRAIRLAEATINRLQKENSYLQEELNAEHNFEEMIGSSPVMQEVFRKIQHVSTADSTVLLQGETGTGKELIASAIHNLSPRKEKVMVKVNCAALPSGLVESELFGHEKGAFTGATVRKAGRFELAHEGTILLDEVSELPLESQSKLLRVLQEGEFERVGGTQTLKVDARVIASTNRNLLEAVQVGAFREDLYYRLNVFPILIPPLRLRGEDISLLSYYFVDRFSKKMHKRINGISPQSMQRLKHYRWPGNVRELASVIERAVILCEGNALEEVDVPVGDTTASQYNLKLEEVQRQHILDVLDQCRGTIEGPRGAAAKLGMNPATLRSRLKKLGIVRRENRFVQLAQP